MQKALYFMPDISGFTQFVNTTEIEHSIHIIAELLEILLDNNTLDLKLAEIEGDALFMYTTKSFSFEDLMHQTNQMMVAFHTHTKTYENKRICNCGSCKTTHNLQLKFVVHYGDLNFIKVKEITKPYGKDVIKAHRLLKNNIPLNEYLLITDSVYEIFENEIDVSWEKQTQVYDFQEINYFYKNLSFIEKELTIEQSKSVIEEDKEPNYSIQKTMDANIDALYELLSELKYRHLWDEEVKELKFDENKINRVGTQHNCVLQFGSLNFETISEKSEISRIFGEKTTEMLFTNDFYYVIKLTPINAEQTNLELEFFIDFTTIGQLMQVTLLKMLSKMWNKKLNKLNQLAKNKSFNN